MSMFFVDIFNAVDASFSMKWNPGLILRLFKSVVNYVKACIISLSIIIFVIVFRMVLQSYTYITYMYLFSLLDIIGKRPHKSE